MAFQNMIRGILLASDEKLSLLVQHMADGSESKAFVERLNRVSIFNADVSLERSAIPFNKDSAAMKQLHNYC